jgi:hypothetical protein
MPGTGVAGSLASIDAELIRSLATSIESMDPRLVAFRAALR